MLTFTSTTRNLVPAANWATSTSVAGPDPGDHPAPGAGQSALSSPARSRSARFLLASLTFTGGRSATTAAIAKVAPRCRAQAMAQKRGDVGGPGLQLEQVIGHLPAVSALRRQLRTRTLSHAYWISGPPQVGKTSLALAVAAELLEAQGWPGGLLSHPDLWLDDGGSSIKIERIPAPGDPTQTRGRPDLQHFPALLLRRVRKGGRDRPTLAPHPSRLQQPCSGCWRSPRPTP